MSPQLWVKITVGGEYTMTSDVYDVPVTIAEAGCRERVCSAAGGLDNDGSSLARPQHPNFFGSGFLGAGDGIDDWCAVMADSGRLRRQVIYSKSGTNPQGQLTWLIHSWNKPDGTQDGKQHQYCGQEQLDRRASCIGSAKSWCQDSDRSARRRTSMT